MVPSKIPSILNVLAFVGATAATACSPPKIQALAPVAAPKPQPRLTLIATLHAKAGKEEELGRRLLALVAPTRSEEGCVNYDLHQSADDPKAWVLYENWRSKADLEKHFETPYLKDFVAHLDEVLESKTDFNFLAMKSKRAASNP